MNQKVIKEFLTFKYHRGDEIRYPLPSRLIIIHHYFKYIHAVYVYYATVYKGDEFKEYKYRFDGVEIT